MRHVAVCHTGSVSRDLLPLRMEVVTVGVPEGAVVDVRHVTAYRTGSVFRDLLPLWMRVLEVGCQEDGAV